MFSPFLCFLPVSVLVNTFAGKSAFRVTDPIGSTELLGSVCSTFDVNIQTRCFLPATQQRCLIDRQNQTADLEHTAGAGHKELLHHCRGGNFCLPQWRKQRNHCCHQRDKECAFKSTEWSGRMTQIYAQLFSKSQAEARVSMSLLVDLRCVLTALKICSTQPRRAGCASRHRSHAALLQNMACLPRFWLAQGIPMLRCVGINHNKLADTSA